LHTAPRGWQRSSREKLEEAGRFVMDQAVCVSRRREEVTSREDDDEKDELAITADHPACSLPPPDTWPDRPLLLRKSAMVHGTSSSDAGFEAKAKAEAEAEAVEMDRARCQLGVPFAVETELFVGHAVLRLRSTPGCEEYFAGKARRTSFVVSGRFKRTLPFAQLYTGQEFERALKMSGATKLVIRGVLKAIRLLAPLLRVHLSERGSHLLSPLVQTAQAMLVSTTPLVLTPAVVVPESTALVGGALGGAARAELTAAERRSHFSVAANLAGLSFDPAVYYSFDFYDNKLCLDTFSLDLLGRHDLVRVLAGQPIRLLSRVLDVDAPGAAPAFGWDVEVWHEQLLAGAVGRGTAHASPRTRSTGAARA